MKALLSASILLALLSLITGVIYPLLITLIGDCVFPTQVSGSLISRNGVVVGSKLIGQQFDSELLFWSRPSATSPTPYNASASSGSNLSPSNGTLRQNIEKLIAKRYGETQAQKIPIDLVSSSASGLDPHITPAAAYFQVARIATNTKISEEILRELIKQHTEERLMGILGERVVNTLALNIELLDLIERKDGKI